VSEKLLRVFSEGRDLFSKMQVQELPQLPVSPPHLYFIIRALPHHPRWYNHNNILFVLATQERRSACGAPEGTAWSGRRGDRTLAMHMHHYLYCMGSIRWAWRGWAWPRLPV